MKKSSANGYWWWKGDDDFGDDFDEFEEGENDVNAEDDFGDFDEGFEDNYPKLMVAISSVCDGQSNQHHHVSSPTKKRSLLWYTYSPYGFICHISW